MASENTLQLNDQNFDETIQGHEAVLVDLWAEWCGPCRMLGPVIEQIADEYAGKAAVGKLDVDDARETAGKLGVQSIPTVVLYQNGEVTQKWVGVQPKQVYTDALDQAISATA